MQIHNVYGLCSMHVLVCMYMYGVFSRVIKTVKIASCIKGREREDQDNCRPNSILPYFSKCFETNYDRQALELCGKNSRSYSHPNTGFISGRDLTVYDSNYYARQNLNCI